MTDETTETAPTETVLDAPSDTPLFIYQTSEIAETPTYDPAIHTPEQGVVLIAEGADLTNPVVDSTTLANPIENVAVETPTVNDQANGQNVDNVLDTNTRSDGETAGQGGNEVDTSNANSVANTAENSAPEGTVISVNTEIPTTAETVINEASTNEGVAQ